MNDWEALLQHLAEIPRENGSAAIHQAAAYLADALRAAGLDVELVDFTAYPYDLRLLGVLGLLTGGAYAACLRAERFGAALLLASLPPPLTLLHVEYGIPVFGGLGAVPQQHIVARLPIPNPIQRLILTAHYDTKTELLDHLRSRPVQRLGLPISTSLVLAALTGLLTKRAGRWTALRKHVAGLVGALAILYAGAFCVTFSAGAVVPARSPGAVDNGAACAVLLRVAEHLAAGPPLARTAVEVILFSGEELSTQGSWHYVCSRFAHLPDIPTYVINLDLIGASRDLRVVGTEASVLRRYAPDSRLVALLDHVYRQRVGTPLAPPSLVLFTDARSFLAHGVPAATLYSHVPPFDIPRGLHSAKDQRSRIDRTALSFIQDFLLNVIREADRHGI
jgi:hypothetical protein